GGVVIKAADGISIGGVIGNLSSPNSISLQAGNTVKLGSTSSIAAGKNSENNSPTIYISAGDASLSAEAGEQLAAPHITLNNPLTGNLLIEGQLTTAGGDISLSATGNSSRATTGLVTVRREIIT